jgi:hypothetical protein
VNDFQATAVMVGLFALRCVLPFALLLAIAYGMNKLVGRWDTQEKRGETGDKPSIPLPMAAATAAALKVPCWVYKNCDEASRARCPACRNPSLACWIALSWAEGRLPAKCANCPRYTGAPAVAIGD